LSYDPIVLIRTRRGDHHEGIAQILWATCAALVFLFIVFGAVEIIDTGDVPPLTVAVVILAALWAAHEWIGLWRDERRGR
jgi:preprotein translocase subunit SecB